jgi:Arc/MetJ-type ribon-helix-helix transcriptional regulator
LETHQGLAKLLRNVMESTGKTFSESDAIRMGLRRLLKEARQAEFAGKKSSRKVLAGEMAEFATVVDQLRS